MEKILILLLSLSSLYPNTYSTYSKDNHKLILRVCHGNAHNFFSAEQFTNIISYDGYMELMHNAKSCLLDDNQKKIIYFAAEKYQVNPLLLLAKMECESGLIFNTIGLRQGSDETKRRLRWAMGYGMYITKVINGKIIKPCMGYESQVYGSARCLRYWHERFEPGVSVDINLGSVKVKPENGAVYALLKYTPFWGKFSENGVKCSGNEILVEVFRRVENLKKSE